MQFRSIVLVLVVALSQSGCGAASSTPPTPPSVEVDVRASRMATVVWALDAAAGLRGHDASYRSWIAPGGNDPAWLAAYAARRPLWNDAQRDGAPTFQVCSFDHDDRTSLEQCWATALSDEDQAIAHTALLEAEAAVSPFWEADRERMEGMAHQLESAIASEEGASLIAWLRRESRLGDAPLVFHVRLLAKPLSQQSHAQQLGHYLPYELESGATLAGVTGITFHEMCHLAHALSPARSEIEAAFAASGEEGVLAGGLWDEVTASAFGNGLAEGRFSTTSPSSDRSYYADPVIDRVAHALHHEWQAGIDVALGAPFAEHLLTLTQVLVTREERTMDRYLWYTTVYADSVEVVLAARAQGRRSFSGSTDHDDLLPPGEGLPPWSPRIVVLDRAALISRPGLQTTLRMTSAALAPTQERARVWRCAGVDGALVLAVVVERNDDAASAATALTRLPSMPSLGWSTLTL